MTLLSLFLILIIGCLAVVNLFLWTYHKAYKDEAEGYIAQLENELSHVKEDLVKRYLNRDEG
ncbi:MAG: hypothetical protein [Podoviridae sp. ctLUJ1]|nr:MAG: hypothetical protein [Podoviridae sp. ctLUJ1]